MAEDIKKRGRKKKEVSQEVIDETKVVTSSVEDLNDDKTVNEVEVPVDVTKEDNVDDISSIIDEVMYEEIKEVVEEETKKEVERHIASCFTTEEKLYIVKLISNGYRPFDIVKKARFALKLSDEKLKRLSLNVRTVEQLIAALED